MISHRTPSPSYVACAQDYLSQFGSTVTSACFLNEDSSLIPLVLTNCPNVREIGVCSIAIDNPALVQIWAAANNLENVYGQGISAGAFQALVEACPNLQEVRFTVRGRWTPEDFANTARFHQLQVLRMYGLHLSTATHVPTLLAANCPQLRHIEVETICSRGLTALAEGCTLLETLAAQVTGNLKAAALAAIAAKWSRLQVLELLLDQISNWSSEHEAALLQILFKCREIDTIKCIGAGAFWQEFPPNQEILWNTAAVPVTPTCTSIVELQVVELGLTSLQQLSGCCPRLRAYTQTGFIDAAEVQLLASTPAVALSLQGAGLTQGDLSGLQRLTHLRLSHLSTEMEGDIIALSARCPQLQELWLTYMHLPQLTNLPVIARNCPLLEEVSYRRDEEHDDEDDDDEEEDGEAVVPERTKEALLGLMQLVCPNLITLEV